MYLKAIVTGCVLLILPGQTSLAQPAPVGINCGSNEIFVSPTGETFHADLPYSADRGYGYAGGRPATTSNPELIGGREGAEPLYRNLREGTFSYQFDVEDGIHAVKLFMADILMHGPGFRSFSVAVEGDTVIRNLDVVEKVGHAFGWTTRLAVPVSDGQLNLGFFATPDAPILSGILVRGIEEDNEPPPAPEGFETVGGYEMNILFWDWSHEPDLGEYRVYRRSGGSDWVRVSEQGYPLYRYLDYEVEPGIEYQYRVTAVDLWGNESAATVIRSAVPIANAMTDLARIQVEVGEDALHELYADYWSIDYVDADLVIDNIVFPRGGVRFRGAFTRHFSKKNYKLKLPGNAIYRGRDRINLNSEMIDYTMLRDRFAYGTYDLLTDLNPERRDVHLEINGEYRGVYLEIEQVDNYFLERRGLSTAGNLYEAHSGLWPLPNCESYRNNYVQENNENSDCSDIIEFIHWIDTATDHRFKCKAGSRFDADQFLDVYVGMIATAELDNGWHNYFLYNDPVEHRWKIISWDHNYSLSDPYSPIDLYSAANPSPLGGHVNRLVERVLAEPLFRYAYCKKLERFLDNEFSVEASRARLGEIHDVIYFDAQRDVFKNGWEQYELLLWGLDAMNRFVRERVPFLRAEISEFIPDPDRGPEFRLNEVQIANNSTVQDEFGDFDPWIEIINRSPVDLDLGGFVLYYGAQSWTISDKAVVEAEGSLVLWLDGEPGEGPLHASFAMTAAGEQLRLVSAQGTLADSTTVPNMKSDLAWARKWDRSGPWLISARPTPGSTNRPFSSPTPVVINEILAINDNVNRDEAGEYDDWIEIHNTASYPISLGGLYLTDDVARPTRWAFPDTLLGAGGYMIVWCDDDAEQGWFHATFKLSGDGEQAALVDRDGVTIIDSITFGPQEANVSYGRLPDGSDHWQFLIPSPGVSNEPFAARWGDAERSTAAKYTLHQNHPNPFNSITTIRFELNRSRDVRLTVFDITGRTVAEPVNGAMPKGEHQIRFEMDDLASGIYFYRLQVDGSNAVKKMILLR